jgi:hypothetical protein
MWLTSIWATNNLAGIVIPVKDFGFEIPEKQPSKGVKTSILRSTF